MMWGSTILKSSNPCFYLKDHDKHTDTLGFQL